MAIVRRGFCYTVPKRSDAEMASYIHETDGFIRGVIHARHARVEGVKFDPASRRRYVRLAVPKAELERLIADLEIKGIKPVGD